MHNEADRFCLWLNGFLEACGDNVSGAQLQAVRTRLDAVLDAAQRPTCRRRGAERDGSPTKACLGGDGSYQELSIEGDL